MHILLLVTAHNSLSQRISLLLSELSNKTSFPHHPYPSSSSFATHALTPSTSYSSAETTPDLLPPTTNSIPLPLPPARNSSKGITYTIELALSPEKIIEAVELAKPDLILCPFLTKRVPKEVYGKYLTLILHPGPPGDAGPSALDWVLSGDDGTNPDSEQTLKGIMGEKEWAEFGCDDGSGTSGKREWWGVTCLQAEEELDEGPTWAFEQFRIPPNATKSSLYRTEVTQAACKAILCALDRVEKAYISQYSLVERSDRVRNTFFNTNGIRNHTSRYPINLVAPSNSITHDTHGNQSNITHTQHRPLLKASERAPNPSIHTAKKCASLIRAGDSQPGVLTKMFGGKGLFIYGAHVQTGEEDGDDQVGRQLEALIGGGVSWANIQCGTIVAKRQGAILIKTAPSKHMDDQGIALWITHARLPMPKETKLLPPKLPICDALVSAGLGYLLDGVQEWELKGWEKVEGTFQQVWVEEEKLDCAEGGTVLYVHFDFYNGACSTSQCELLLKAIMESVDRIKDTRIVCLMGSRNYFSNGIALNVIEGHNDPSGESWRNINAIDDIVELILGDSSTKGKIHRSDFLQNRSTLAERGILTISAIQANAAAGGLALATCADIVLCSSNAVLNPHYRGVGLFGSEAHTYHWPARIGQRNFEAMAKAMLPMSPIEAERLGLIDRVVGHRLASHQDVEQEVKRYISELACARSGEIARYKAARWTQPPTDNETHFPASSLIDTLIANKIDNHRALTFPLVFYRNEELSQMLLDFFHPTRSERYHSRRKAFVRKFAAKATPLRFAEHRRLTEDGQIIKYDEEERDDFDIAPGWVRGEEWRWAREWVPDGFLGFGGLKKIYSQFGGRGSGLDGADSALDPLAPRAIQIEQRAIAFSEIPPPNSDEHLQAGQQHLLVSPMTNTASLAISRTSSVIGSEVPDSIAAAFEYDGISTASMVAPSIRTGSKRDSLVSFENRPTAVHRYSSTDGGIVSAGSVSALLAAGGANAAVVSQPMMTSGYGNAYNNPSVDIKDQVIPPGYILVPAGPSASNNNNMMEMTNKDNHNSNNMTHVENPLAPPTSSSTTRARKTSSWGIKVRPMSRSRPSTSSGVVSFPPNSFGMGSASLARSETRHENSNDRNNENRAASFASNNNNGSSGGSGGGGSTIRGSIRKALNAVGGGSLVIGTPNSTKISAAKMEAIQAQARSPKSNGYPSGIVGGNTPMMSSTMSSMPGLGKRGGSIKVKNGFGMGLGKGMGQGQGQGQSQGQYSYVSTQQRQQSPQQHQRALSSSITTTTTQIHLIENQDEAGTIRPRSAHAYGHGVGVGMGFGVGAGAGMQAGQNDQREAHIHTSPSPSTSPSMSISGRKGLNPSVFVGVGAGAGAGPNASTHPNGHHVVVVPENMFPCYYNPGLGDEGDENDNHDARATSGVGNGDGSGKASVVTSSG